MALRLLEESASDFARFGGGFFLALACDWRVMRTQKGFLNFPELNLGMRLSKPFAELAKAHRPPPHKNSEDNSYLLGTAFSASRLGKTNEGSLEDS